eukprot:TRINITY_DN825_c2_g1_i1.p4 TRINITY_DN825_c2_g1~~TRINITY_DN825_c2_g1_i1.p4  ORF type:complete len:105 (-),score=5.70 TRINITY_DN825_c2_g1_i1:1027-1341(-)
MTRLQVKAIVAVTQDGRAVGLAHYRPFPRPLRATVACFLDDLFVQEDFRRAGVGTALIREVAKIARSKGWSSVRWITSESNHRAQAVYDRIATKLDKLTYEMPV